MAIYAGKNMPKEVGRATMDSRIGSRTALCLARTNRYTCSARRTIGLSTLTNPRSGRSNIWASTVRMAPSRFAAFIRRSPASPKVPRSCTCTAAVSSSGRPISSTPRCGSSPRTAARKSTPSTTSSRRSTSSRYRSRRMSSLFAGSTRTRMSAALTPHASRSAAIRPAATRRASWPSSCATSVVRS